MKIYDISVPISERTIVYPGDPPVRLIWDMTIPSGRLVNLSSISFCSHTGTHIDAPFHFLNDGISVDQVSLELLYGECLVVEIDNPISIGLQALERAGVTGGTQRILFKTRNSAFWKIGTYPEDYVFIESEAAEWLVERGIQLVGIDWLSVDPFDTADFPAHRSILGSGGVVVEGLDLSDVPPGTYTLACMPLKIAGGDGSPSRAVLIDNNE